MTPSWLDDVRHQWGAWLDAAAGHPGAKRWCAGYRAGKVATAARLADPGRLREQLRVVMNETVNEEYPDGLIDPLAPYGEHETREHHRLTIIAGKLSILMVADMPAPENPGEEY